MAILDVTQDQWINNHTSYILDHGLGNLRYLCIGGGPNGDRADELRPQCVEVKDPLEGGLVFRGPEFASKNTPDGPSPFYNLGKQSSALTPMWKGTEGLEPTLKPWTTIERFFNALNTRFQGVMVDAQGEDLEILRGAGKYTTRLRCIVMEVIYVGCKWEYDGSPKPGEVAEFMGKEGFKLRAMYRVKGDGKYANHVYVRD